MLDDDRQILICMPWSYDLMARVPGNTVENCVECGQRVCVAPGSHQLLAERPEMEIICMSCAPTDVDEKPMVTQKMVEEVAAREGISEGVARHLMENVTVGQVTSKVQRQIERERRGRDN